MVCDCEKDCGKDIKKTLSKYQEFISECMESSPTQRYPYGTSKEDRRKQKEYFVNRMQKCAYEWMSEERYIRQPEKFKR